MRERVCKRVFDCERDRICVFVRECLLVSGDIVCERVFAGETDQICVIERVFDLRQNL